VAVAPGVRVHTQGEHLAAGLGGIDVPARTDGREADHLLPGAAHQQHVARARGSAQRVAPDSCERGPVELVQDVLGQDVGVGVAPYGRLHQTDRGRIARAGDPGACVSDRAGRGCVRMVVRDGVRVAVVVGHAAILPSLCIHCGDMSHVDILA